jgi:hypothetical protein
VARRGDAGVELLFVRHDRADDPCRGRPGSPAAVLRRFTRLRPRAWAPRLRAEHAALALARELPEPGDGGGSARGPGRRRRLQRRRRPRVMALLRMGGADGALLRAAGLGARRWQDRRAVAPAPRWWPGAGHRELVESTTLVGPHGVDLPPGRTVAVARVLAAAAACSQRAAAGPRETWSRPASASGRRSGSEDRAVVAFIAEAGPGR